MSHIVGGWGVRLVDPDLLRSKTERVLHHVERLRRRASLGAEALRGDEDLYNAVLMDLQQAIQACIDLALHACVDENLGAPAGPAEAFAMLARAGRIDASLRVKLTGAAGLRNLIVHRYSDIDTQRILQVIKEEIGDLERFVRVIRNTATPGASPPTPPDFGQ